MAICRMAGDKPPPAAATGQGVSHALSFIADAHGQASLNAGSAAAGGVSSGGIAQHAKAHHNLRSAGTPMIADSLHFVD